MASSRRFLTVLLLLGLALEARVAEGQDPDSRPGIAVLPFENGGSLGEPLPDQFGVGLQMQLINELSVNTDVRTVERSRLEEVFRELGLSEDEAVDPQTAIEAGRLVGARYLLIGTFTDWPDRMTLVARVTDSQTGEHIRAAAASVEGQRADVFDMLVELGDDLTRLLDLPPLETERREARRDEVEEIPAEAITLWAQAETHERMGNTAEAIQTYERVLAEYPGIEPVEERLGRLRG